MTISAPLTRITLLLPRLSDDDAYFYGEGDPDAAWAMRLIWAVGPGAVQEIGPTQTLLIPSGEAVSTPDVGGEGGRPERLFVPRRLADDELPDPDMARFEVMEIVEVGMATDSTREIEAVITVLPFGEYRVHEPD